VVSSLRPATRKGGKKVDRLLYLLYRESARRFIALYRESITIDRAVCLLYRERTTTNSEAIMGIYGRRKPTCGYCHRQGHTRKTCPQDYVNAGREFEDKNYNFCSWCYETNHCGRDCLTAQTEIKSAYAKFDERCRKICEQYAKKPLEENDLLIYKKWNGELTDSMFLYLGFEDVSVNYQKSSDERLSITFSMNVAWRGKSITQTNQIAYSSGMLFRDHHQRINDADPSPISIEKAEAILFPEGIGNRTAYNSHILDTYVKRLNAWEQSSLQKKRGRSKKNLDT
jgi:hypothetical protein